MIRSLQRVRERQARVAVKTSPQPTMPSTDNVSTIHTITPDGERRTTPRAQWNSSTSYQATKVPRSVVREGNRPAENVVQRQVIPSGPPNRSSYSPEMSSPVKVVRLPPTTVEEPYRTAPSYVQQSYQPNTRLIRTDPEGLI